MEAAAAILKCVVELVCEIVREEPLQVTAAVSRVYRGQ